MSSRSLVMEDLKAFASAARAIGMDAVKTKDELERLVRMIIHDEVEVQVERIDPETNKKEIIMELREVEVSEMISSTLILVFQDEKFRRGVPTGYTEQLMVFLGVVKRRKMRGLHKSLLFMKDRLRVDIMRILHTSYPSWHSLVPEGTMHMLDALSEQRKGQPQGLTDFDKQFSPDFSKQLSS